MIRVAVVKWGAWVEKRILEKDALITSGRLSERQYVEECARRNELAHAKDELFKMIRQGVAEDEQ